MPFFQRVTNGPSGQDPAPQEGDPEPVESRASFDRSLLFIMAAATGLAVASQYYNQPLLGLIAEDLQAGTGSSIVATLTQIGYAIGLVLLVPLGDRLNRRWVILTQCLGLMLAMIASALSPSLSTLAVSAVFVGIFATIAQQIIPFAAELAPEPQREQSLSLISSGLLAGVLLARTLSGLVGTYFGWRAVFFFGAALIVAMTVGLASRLPDSKPQTRDRYDQLLLSLWTSLKSSAVLRQATLSQSLLFFGFSAFWTILVLLLRDAPFELGADVAGSFGILALIVVPVIPFAIRTISRGIPRRAVFVGILLVAASFVVMACFTTLAGIAVGVLLMTAGLQMALIANQSLIFAAAGNARGRFNTVFMAGQFSFGALGSATAGWAWSVSGWPAVMALALVSAVLSLAVQIVRRS
jgi:predicted MFS family arabinose efflux permease